MVYSHDFASLPKIALLQWRLYPDFVALPQTTEEVSGVVKLSDESLLQITPRGGGTGWCGGAVPNRGGVLIDMRKMNHILGIDPDGRTVSVETGVSWKDVEDRKSTRLNSSHTVISYAVFCLKKKKKKKKKIKNNKMNMTEVQKRNMIN